MGDNLPPTKIEFKYTTGPYGWLSNFSLHQVQTDDGDIYATSEHYYQTLKFHDEWAKSKIRVAPSAKLAAQLGRTLPGMRSDWDKVKLDAMRKVLRLKLRSNPILRTRLLETGGAELVELSNKDTFWGRLPSGQGENWLGRLWMELRASLSYKGFPPTE